LSLSFSRLTIDVEISGVADGGGDEVTKWRRLSAAPTIVELLSTL